MKKILFLTLFLINSQVHSNIKNIKGCLLGAAIGDALGRATEFIFTVDDIKKIYPNGVRTFDDFRSHDFIVGKALYTDDTVMSLIVAQEVSKLMNPNIRLESQSIGGPERFAYSIPLHPRYKERGMCLAKPNILCGAIINGKDTKIVIKNLSNRFAALFGNDRYKIDPYYAYRAHGNTNGSSCSKLLKNPLDMGDLEKNKTIFDKDFSKQGGCGSVMRAWPIGLFNLDENTIKKLADEQSLITHKHPMARAASAALAVGISTIIKAKYAKKEITSKEVIDAMVKTAQEYDSLELLYKTNSKKIKTDIFTKIDPELIKNNKLLTSDMIKYAYSMAINGESPEGILGTHDDKLTNHRSTEGFLLGWAADEALAAAVYVFTRHFNNLKSGLIEAVNTPGDSDSIATIAGALIGAYSSIDSLDGFNYSKLENLNGINDLALQIGQSWQVDQKKSRSNTDKKASIWSHKYFLLAGIGTAMVISYFMFKK